MNGKKPASPEGSDAEAAPVGWLRFLDHTADTGIIVRGSGLRELFARAAWGMFSVITDPAKVVPRLVEAVVVEATDEAALMVRWLSELNFRHVTCHVVYGRFEVLELEPGRLTARVAGEKIDPGRHTIYTEIKAVTFHGLEIRSDRDGFEVQIIFDL